MTVEQFLSTKGYIKEDLRKGVLIPIEWLVEFSEKNTGKECASCRKETDKLFLVCEHCKEFSQ